MGNLSCAAKDWRGACKISCNLAEIDDDINARRAAAVSLYPDYPPCLVHGDFAIVRFGLMLQADACLTLDTLLGLRGLLRQAAREMPGEQGVCLFDPPLSDDPVAARRFQKPAPGFVVMPDTDFLGEQMAGDMIRLEMLFLGTAVQSIGDFLPILQRLGSPDPGPSALRFQLAEVEAMCPDGRWRRLWRSSQRNTELVPVLLRIDQWLEQRWPAHLPVVLGFSTPLRLVAGGRILRRPRFDQLFPFMLRRVTSMLHYYCTLEAVDDPSPLLDAAREIEGSWTGIEWIDWREIGDDKHLGGMTGVLRLEGAGLESLLWVILLAAQWGIGKGAAYGAGRYRVSAAV
jgi:hypothetical protein